MNGNIGLVAPAHVEAEEFKEEKEIARTASSVQEIANRLWNALHLPANQVKFNVIPKLK